MAPISSVVLFVLSITTSVYGQLSTNFNLTADMDPLEESILNSILRSVDEKFESLSTRMNTMERGMNTLQYYNLRQFRTVNTHLHTVDNLLQNLGTRLEQQDIGNGELATSLLLIKREVKNAAMMNQESFDKMAERMGSMSHELGLKVALVEKSIIKAMNDTAIQQDEVASVLREIVVSERDRTKQICSESLAKVQTRIDDFENMTINRMAILENATMSVISNINVTVDPASVDINATARRLLEERLQEFNDNVLDSIRFYRHTGDLVERIVGATESVADDQVKLREDIKHFLELQVNLTSGYVQKVEGQENISNVIPNDVNDIIVEKSAKNCEITSAVMEEIQLMYRNGSQVLDVIAEMTRSSQNELKTTIQQLNNEVFKLQEMRSEEETPHPEMLSGQIDFHLEEISNNTRAVFHIVEAIASNTGWIPYIFTNLQFLENQINQTLVTAKMVFRSASLQNSKSPNTLQDQGYQNGPHLSDDPNLMSSTPRNQDTNTFSEKDVESAEGLLSLNQTMELQTQFEFVYETNKRVNRILPALTRLLGEPESRQSYEPFVVMVDGSSEYEGRVEIYQKGRWGSLCKPLSHVEASYICRHLGYLGGIASEPGYFGEGSGVFWDMNFTCLLSRQCSIARPVLDSSSCDHEYDAGVICDNMVRLWFESKNDLKVKRNTGFLEIHHREEWIPVCSDNWTENNSKVACQQLGYNGGMATPPTEEVMTYHPDTHVFYSNITCTGSEKRLTACESELKVNGCSSKLPVFIQCIH